MKYVSLSFIIIIPIVCLHVYIFLIVTIVPYLQYTETSTEYIERSTFKSIQASDSSMNLDKED